MKKQEKLREDARRLKEEELRLKCLKDKGLEKKNKN